MPMINNRACVANGRNLLTGTANRTVTGQSNYGHFSDDDLLTLFQGLEGKTVTLSFDYEYSGFVAGSDKNRLGWEIGITADSTSWFAKWYSPDNDSGSGRISSTFVVPKNITGILEGYGYIEFSGSGAGTLSNFKLEKGSVATPLTPAPVDKVFSNGKQVYGRNLLTGTADHIVTGSGSNANGYLSNETNDDFLSLFQGLEGQTVTLSVDYKYSGFVAGSDRNRLGWEIEIIAGSTSWHGAWHSPNNDSGAGRISNTFVVPENITSIAEGRGYIEFSGSGTGTLSHLKLEKGSVATPWSPAPEDVLN